MTITLEKIRVFLWRILKGSLIRSRYRKTRKVRTSFINVMDSQMTVDYIISHNCSVARFGDGEFQMISHGLEGGGENDFPVDTFQSFDKELSSLLNNVLTCDRSDLLVCIPYAMLRSDIYKGYNRIFFEREWLGRENFMTGNLAKDKVFGDSLFSRFYLNRRDIKNYAEYLSKLKRIWDKKDVVIVEGRFSRLGVGNDLFDNTNSIRRVLCPARNAFSSYHNILSFIKTSFKSQSPLFLLALGHTATVLAYDLANMGFQAIDIGHIDIEYEWFRMGAKDKVPVKNKYVNEVKEGRILSNMLQDSEYHSQIMADIQ